MIARNEERYLEGCLQSVRDLVDEIILVDTGSTDATPEIARRYGAEVHEFEWRDDFAAARNESLRHASGDWILYLDADERLSEENREELIHWLRHETATIVSVLVDSPNRSGPGHVSRSHRLFRNLPGLRFSGRVHEQISPSFAEGDYREGFSNIRILHLGYAKSRSEIQSKNWRNLRLIEMQLAEEPDNFYWHFCLAQVYLLDDNYLQAVKSLQNALQLGQIPKDIACTIYNNLCEANLRLRNFEEAIRYGRKALAISAQQITSYLLLYQAFTHKQDVAEQIRCLEAIVRLLEKDSRRLGSSALDAQVDLQVVRLRLARLYLKQRNYIQAVSSFEKVLKVDPENVEALNGLSDCMSGAV